MRKNLKIQKVVETSEGMYEFNFESASPVKPDASLLIPKSWFRNLGAPRQGDTLILEQTDGRTLFTFRGKTLGSPQTRLTASPEKLALYEERNRRALERRQAALNRQKPNNQPV